MSMVMRGVSGGEVGVALVERSGKDKGRALDVYRTNALFSGVGARAGTKRVATLQRVVPLLRNACTQCRRVSGLPCVCSTIRCAQAGRNRQGVGRCGKLMRLRIDQLTNKSRTRFIGQRTTLLPRAFTTFYNSDNHDIGV